MSALPPSASLALARPAAPVPLTAVLPPSAAVDEPACAPGLTLPAPAPPRPAAGALIPVAASAIAAVFTAGPSDPSLEQPPAIAHATSQQLSLRRAPSIA